MRTFTLNHLVGGYIMYACDLSQKPVSVKAKESPVDATSICEFCGKPKYTSVFFKPMENITISDAYIYICIDTSIYDDIISIYCV
jgi:hypothetical protein